MGIIDPVEKHQLLPLVRSRFYYEVTRLRIAANVPDAAEGLIAHEPLFKVIGRHLAVSIAVDLPKLYRHLSQDDLDKLGLTFSEALEIAKRNFATDVSRFPDGVRFAALAEGFYCPEGEVAEHNSALILYPQLFRQLPLKGDPILFLPHTDMFWVTGSEQSDMVSLLCGLTMQEMEDHPKKPITTIPFILLGDQWQAWQPPPAHPAFHDVRELYDEHLARIYTEQRELLRKQLEATGRDVYVAEYRPMSAFGSPASGMISSLALWTETLPTLLPKVDVVRMQRLLNRQALDEGTATAPQFGEAINVLWDQLQKLDSPPRPQEMYPERYLVEQFPNEITWRTLKQNSVSLPVELQQSQSSTQETTQPPASSTKPRQRSGVWLVGFGCLLGCGGSIAALVFLFILNIYLASRQEFRPSISDKFKLRNPDRTRVTQDESDYEVGDLEVQLPSVRLQTLRDLPPFSDLPAGPLPTLGKLPAGLTATGMAGGETRDFFEDRPPPGGVLVGLRLVKGVEWNGAIRSLQPIYQVDDHYVLGSVHGPSRGIDQIQYLAKPGYVVAKVRVRAGLALNAIQVEFWAIDPNDGHVHDYYTTAWFGCPGGAEYTLEKGPFVGVDGCVASEIVSIQLQRAGASVEE